MLWTRVETPNGVIVEIDSPGTDPLGRSGHDGYIDNHFWQRFGGAMLLSLLLMILALMPETKLMKVQKSV